MRAMVPWNKRKLWRVSKVTDLAHFYGEKQGEYSHSPLVVLVADPSSEYSGDTAKDIRRNSQELRSRGRVAHGGNDGRQEKGE